jgi:hypothetical protein
MPIQIDPVTNSDISILRKNFEKLSRNAFNLQDPFGKTGTTYISTAPTTDELAERQAVFYLNGSDYRLYFNINNTIKYVSLS